MARKVQIMDEATINRSLARITHEIIEKNEGCDGLVILGIKTRGVRIAQALKENILKFEGVNVAVGSIDVTMHRDDYTAEEKAKKATESDIPCSLENKTVVLADDVLYTGRTVRAGIETIFSLARPKAVQLAVLVDRGHREVPIRPDFVGKNIPTAKHEKVSVVSGGEEENGVFIISD